MLNSPTNKMQSLSAKMRLLYRSSSIFHHQHRTNRLSTKSQSRSQSTLNPRIEAKAQSGPIYKQKHTIRTTLRTALDDSLIPCYLQETYWWAYINPNAVKFWERQWLVDAILWGNFNKLKHEAIGELCTMQHSDKNKLNVTQIACVYGNFSTDLVSAIQKMHINGYNACEYKIVDIAPIQLINTKNKIDAAVVRNDDTNAVEVAIDLYQNDSSNIELIQSNSEDITYLFFLLHEQPKDVRLKTIEETIRITKMNGKIVIVDYHKPRSKLNPFRYIMRPILTYLEPFAIDLWNEQITDYIKDLNEKNQCNVTMEKQLYFNGLYQKIVLTKS